MAVPHQFVHQDGREGESRQAPKLMVVTDVILCTLKSADYHSLLLDKKVNTKIVTCQQTT